MKWLFTLIGSMGLLALLVGLACAQNRHARTAVYGAPAAVRNVGLVKNLYSNSDNDQSGSNGSDPPLLRRGVHAPDFTVRDPSGRPVKLSRFKGRVVLIDFWAMWCGPCQETLPDTNAVAREFKNKNVVALAINVWDTPEAFRDWLPQHRDDNALKFVIDRSRGGQYVTNLYHVSGIPSQYIIDKHGRVSASFVVGAKEDLEGALRAALSR
ncbi:MAG TPA: TlpA disulfide reductase family protein [Capsulimonadaceae bacterium]|nr:TlpA disulfide reductase family protein [Capsulimonadaceae bacterium]